MKVQAATKVLPLVLALVCVALARPARAADYLVSGAGDDAAAGTATAPWRTLQRVWRTLRAGDTVTVEDGSYAGFACDGVSGTATARIVVRARNRWGAKINAAGGSAEDYVQLSSCSYVTVDGFEVSGAPRSGIAILGNADDGSDARGVTIQNCYAHDNGGTVVAGRHDGVFSGFALDLTIQDNRIDRCGEHGIYVSNAADNPAILRNLVSNTGNNCIQINADLSTGGDGLISNWRIEGNVVRDCRGSAAFNLDGAVRGVARNNVIYNAAKGGITLFQGDGAEASHDNVIVNNTIYNPTGSRSAIQVADGANNNVIFNNILYAQAAGIEIQANVTGLMHDYNLVSSYDGGSAAAHESSPAAAALFVGPTTGDLQLLTSAAAVGGGIASLGGAAAPAVDVLGAPRPAGAAIDIGAYEQGSTAPPTGTGGIGAGGASGGSGVGAGTGGATGGAGTGGRGGASGGPSGGSAGAGGSATGPGATGGSVTGGCGCDVGARRRPPAALLFLGWLGGLAAPIARSRRRRP